MNVNELPTPVNQKDATFTIHVNETVVGLVQCNKSMNCRKTYSNSELAQFVAQSKKIKSFSGNPNSDYRGTYEPVDAATRKTTRTKKVSRQRRIDKANFTNIPLQYPGTTTIGEIRKDWACFTAQHIDFQVRFKNIRHT